MQEKFLVKSFQEFSGNGKELTVRMWKVNEGRFRINARE